MLRPQFNFCFAFAILLGSLCARAAEQKYATFDDSKGRFHMDRPQEWEERHPSNPITIVAFLHEQPQFGDNVNIAIEELSSKVSEDDLDKVLKLVLARQVHDFHLISDEPTDVSGHHVHRMVYTATIRGRKVQFTQVGLISAKTHYVITFATLPERQKDLDPIIDHVLKSFKLEEKDK